MQFLADSSSLYVFPFGMSKRFSVGCMVKSICLKPTFYIPKMIVYETQSLVTRSKKGVMDAVLMSKFLMQYPDFSQKMHFSGG